MGNLENYKPLLSYINQKTIVIFSCFVILSLPTIMFGLTLDRYPDIHIDESFFNLPAVHSVLSEVMIVSGVSISRASFYICLPF